LPACSPSPRRSHSRRAAHLNQRGLEPAGHRHPGAAGGLCQLPEPTAAGPAGAQP
jgi:hypothetical protein